MRGRWGTYRAGPVLALDVPDAVHDERVTVPVGGSALLAGVGASRGLGTGAPQLLESCPPDGLQQNRASTVQWKELAQIL